MTTTTLFDAARADMRAKLMAIRSFYDVERALSTLSDSIETLRDSVARRDEAGPSEELNRCVLADMFTAATLSQELARHLATHRTLIAAGLFGADALPKA